MNAAAGGGAGPVSRLALPLGLLLAAAIHLGCGRGGGEAEHAASGSGPVAAGAAGVTTATGAGAVDLCSEHGVLRAICTRCNPKLAVVFRANGDFCEEHGQPMSVCPIHHPERGGRPAVDVSAREAPADRTRLRFKSRKTAVEAGFETVVARPGADLVAVPATATIVTDASRRAVVTAGASGIVRAVLVEEGATVSAGTPLARVESGAIADARSRWKSALARLETAESVRRRESDLVEKGIAARKDLEAAEQELQTARAEAAAAEAALRAAGAGLPDVAADSTGTLVLRAPIRGVVTRRSAVVGRYVEPQESLFEIVDPTRLWADLEIGERHAGAVRGGDEVIVHLGDDDADGARGRLVYVAPVVDERSRVVRARARLDGADPRVRVNAVHRATIRSRGEGEAVVVPREAIQEARGAALAFVRLADDLYEARRVRFEPAIGSDVVVRRGLAPGDHVVTVGSYLLLTESDKSAIGTGCCEVEPPSR